MKTSRSSVKVKSTPPAPPAQAQGKLKVPALAGNQNAAKHDEPTVRISARIPASLHEWLALTGNQSTTIIAALEEFRRAQQLTPSPFEWWVYSTAIVPGFLILQCKKTGKFGLVKNPTREEWNAAFYAPSNPYRWLDDSRVVEAKPSRNQKRRI